MNRVLLLLSMAIACSCIAAAQQNPNGNIHSPNDRARFFFAEHMASIAPHTASSGTTAPHQLSGTDVSWLPVGTMISAGTIQGMAVIDDALYVVHIRAEALTETVQGDFFQISRWDGTSWTKVTTFDLNGAVIYGVYAYKGQLYIAGSFLSVSGITGTAHIARWDGTAWKSVGGGIGSSTNYVDIIMDMCEYNGELYCTGAFQKAGGKTVNGIARWDGTQWNNVGLGLRDAPGESTYLEGRCLAAGNGKLYVGGSFTQAGSVAANYIAQWDGTNWAPLAAGMEGLVSKMGTYHDNLFIQTESQGNGTWPTLQMWNGSAWNVVGNNVLNIHSFLVHNDELYACGFDQNFQMMRWDGGAWVSVGSVIPDASLYSLAEYRGALIIGGRFQNYGPTRVSYIAKLCNDGNCGLVSGTVFNDMDGDCAMNGNDRGVKGRIVELTPGPFYLSTDDAGQFSAYAPPGDYTAHLQPFLHWNQTCPAAQANKTFTLAGTHDKSAGNDFAMQPEPNVQDLRVSIASGRARPGFQIPYTITYKNIGTVAMAGTVRFVLDPRLTFVSSNPAPSQQTGNVYDWNFSSLAMEEERSISFMASVPVGTPIDATVCGSAEIVPHQPGFDADDYDTTCVPVTSSHDPNDIQVAPFGIKDNGEITRSDSVLNYIVRFQNTGNDTAFKVVVIDSLPGQLDPGSIVPGAANHPYSLQMQNNGILIWTFENIMLPDSSTNEPASHGFFKYSVRLRPGLAPGTQIPNHAGIYFDYNVPVYTNTVVSVIAGVASVPATATEPVIAIYPNPTAGKLFARGDLLPNAPARVSDILGRTVWASSTTGNAGLALDLSALPPGIYFLTLPITTGTTTRQITITR